MDCIVIVLALARRLGGFHSGGKWHAFLDESPVELLAKTIGHRTARLIVITDSDRISVPASHPRSELIRIPPQPRADIAAALQPLARRELKTSRLLLVDAAAPGLEAQTMARLVRLAAKTDLARLRHDAAAVAITRDGLRRALRAPAGPRAKNLWEWTTRVGEATEAGLRVTDLDGAAWHERTCEEIADVHAALGECRLREALRMVQAGLRLRHPASFDLRGRLRFGSNVSIDSHVTLRGTVTLGDDVVIEPHCILENVRIASGATIKAFTTITDSTIGARCRVGPFARIRPGCSLGPACQIGNYVEVKDTRMQGGCKINHHTFIEIGRAHV